jgi:hypothetical protein
VAAEHHFIISANSDTLVKHINEKIIIIIPSPDLKHLQNVGNYKEHNKTEETLHIHDLCETVFSAVMLLQFP